MSYASLAPLRSTIQFVLIALVTFATATAAFADDKINDRTTWSFQVVTEKDDVVSGVGTGPFTKEFGAGIYLGAGCPPKGTVKENGLRREKMTGDLPTGAEGFSSRTFDPQGFVVTNGTTSAIARIVITQPKKGATFNGLTTAAGISSSVAAGTLTLTFDPPLAPGAALWFVLPPFSVDDGVTIEYMAVPAKQQPKPRPVDHVESLAGAPNTVIDAIAPVCELSTL